MPPLSSGITTSSVLRRPLYLYRSRRQYLCATATQRSGSDLRGLPVTCRVKYHPSTRSNTLTGTCQHVLSTAECSPTWRTSHEWRYPVRVDRTARTTTLYRMYSTDGLPCGRRANKSGPLPSLAPPTFTTHTRGSSAPSQLVPLAPPSRPHRTHKSQNHTHHTLPCLRAPVHGDRLSPNKSHRSVFVLENIRSAILSFKTGDTSQPS